MLKLLKEDEEFRLAVAGLMGLEEALRAIRELREVMARLREDMNKGFELIRRHIDALGARLASGTRHRYLHEVSSLSLA